MSVMVTVQRSPTVFFKRDEPKKTDVDAHEVTCKNRMVSSVYLYLHSSPLMLKTVG